MRVTSLSRYNRTYSISPTKIENARARRELRAFAQTLHKTESFESLVLLDKLLDGDFSFARLRTLFSLLRGALVEMVGDERAAMHAPLVLTGPRAGAFFLHADLYIPQLLINVFDNVGLDDTGASVFLSVSELRDLLPTIDGLPPRIAEAIGAVFGTEIEADRFDELYDLLHGMAHPWVPGLERAMIRRQFRIKLRRGQGYMLNDRVWLHGREAPSGGVPVDRLQRLVFWGCQLSAALRCETCRVSRRPRRAPVERALDT